MIAPARSLKTFGSVAIAAFLLAGCTEDRQFAASAPIAPGGLRRIVRTPVDWELVSQNLVMTVYRCKPLACAKPAFVAFKNRKPLARHPDPEALERFALIDVPKNFLAGDAAQNILSDGKKRESLIRSQAGTALDRPAVLIEARRTDGGNADFVVFNEIFAGPILLQVASTAATLEQAHRNLDLFLSATTLTDGPAV